jgi:hypothetical protein
MLILSNVLEVIYGFEGLPPDNVMAHTWFNIALSNGHEDAGES